MKIRMLLRFRAYDVNDQTIGFCALPFGDYRDSQMTLEELENEISKSINLINLLSKTKQIFPLTCKIFD